MPLRQETASRENTAAVGNMTLQQSCLQCQWNELETRKLTEALRKLTIQVCTQDAQILDVQKQLDYIKIAN